MTRPRVALVSVGGTLDLMGGSRVDHALYYEQCHRVPTDELVGGIPELSQLADLEIIPFDRSSGEGIYVSEWFRLRASIDALAQEGYAGIVITHGTNSLEETAFFLELTLATSVPVVMVGAMRPSGSLGADGELNLYRAVQVAISPAAWDQGVLVVLDDTVHAARDVTKTATFRVGAFRSPDLGPLGYADADGEVVLYRRSRHERGLFVSEATTRSDLPSVYIVVSHVGADGTMIAAAVAAGAQGIVSAGMGAGRPTPEEQRALDSAVRKGVIVCQATRVGSGRVPKHRRHPTRVYADNLQPWKARILLALSLSLTKNSAEIQTLFDQV